MSNLDHHSPLDDPRHRSRLLAVVLSVGILAAGVGALGLRAVWLHPLGRTASLAAGGVGAAGLFLLGVGAMPLARWLLGDRTRARLIAAASPLHPLMRRMMVEAPGTYVHSLAAANLAESAAEAVGADALIARVGAYYHDIGKLTRPCFFFENIDGEGNPHDVATPEASVNVITAHVDDGLTLAQYYRLPPAIVGIIREHHGTTLVRYFYHKASQSGVSAYEADYRYRGVHPASREAAIVMLADGAEASVRALTQPTADEIEATVRSLIEERREDGQLETSGLTDEDFERIVRTFVRTLVSYRHARCQYPVGTMKESGHADQRSEPSRT